MGCGIVGAEIGEHIQLAGAVFTNRVGSRYTDAQADTHSHTHTHKI